MADPRVDRREPVDVEHEESHLLASAPRASDLEVEQGMEGRPIVEVRQRVALGHGIRGLELQRALERRPAHAQDVLERRDVDLAEPAVGRAGQHREHARIGRRLHERDGQPAADRGRTGSLVAREGDLNRPRATVVGHAEPSDLVDLGLRESDGREDRVLPRADDGHRGIGIRLLPGELEDADDARVVGTLESGSALGRRRA